ncbi:MAG TPA: YceI family protein [Streptosporangiaceae bacterium]
MTVSDQISQLTGEWILDPSRSTVSLATKSMGGLARVKGTFGQVTGGGTVSPAGTVTGSLTIATTSIDTKNARRDKHLRSASFFDSDSHPDLTFAAEDVKPSGQDVTVTGMLRIRGRARPLSFTGTAAVHGDGEAWLDAEVPINRADFGMTWNVLGMVSMSSAVTVHAVFARIPAR